MVTLKSAGEEGTVRRHAVILNTWLFALRDKRKELQENRTGHLKYFEKGWRDNSADYIAVIP